MSRLSISIYVLLVAIAAAQIFAAAASRPWPRRTLPRGRQDFTQLCPCALGALAKMDRILRKHHAQSITQPISDVMQEIREVAQACTVRDECRCPEGFHKSADGFSCYMISDEDVTCADANSVCEDEWGGRLAVAKSQESLMTLAKFIHQMKPQGDRFYWIGLSYNATAGGSPLWTWADGSKAAYDVTKTLRKTPVGAKKSLINFVGDDQMPIERVAISKQLKGARWKQEVCGSNMYNSKQASHPFICEYTMFKVQILSEN